MLEDFLFEIQCAEEIGAFKLADSLDRKLIRMATGDHSSIRKQIERKYDSSSGVKSVNFSPSQQKFIINVDAGISNNVKREIKNVADPYGVSFKYSQKNIDQLYGSPEEMDPAIEGLYKAPQIDPLDAHLSRLNALSPDHIGLDELDDMEPTDEELRETAEFPADELSDDPDGLDALLLEEAYQAAQKHLGLGGF